MKTATVDTSGYTKVVMQGAAADVYLATQMIQEVKCYKFNSNPNSISRMKVTEQRHKGHQTLALTLTIFFGHRP
jgi:hypothetical protein